MGMSCRKIPRAVTDVFVFSLIMSTSSLPLRRPTEECAEIVLDLLARNRMLSRKEILQMADLTPSEIDSALSRLRNAGAIRRSAMSKNIRSGVVYERTGVELSRKRCTSKNQSSTCVPEAARPGGCFSGLLEAWNIRVPSAKFGVLSVMRDGFSREERQDLRNIAERKARKRGAETGPMVVDLQFSP